MGRSRQRTRRRQSRIGDDDSSSRSEPLIARMRHRLERVACCFVIPEQRDEFGRQRRRGAVEQGEVAILMPEETKGRIHAVDAGYQLLWQIVPEIDIGLSER